MSSNLAVISPNEAATRQEEMDRFLADFEAELDALIEQAAQPEYANDSTNLDIETTQAVQKFEPVRSQPSYERAWNRLRTLQTVKHRVTEKYAGVRKKSNTLRDLLKKCEDFYLTRIKAAQSEGEQKIAKFYEERSHEWLERQAALEAAAEAQAPAGEAAQAVVAPHTLEKMPGGSLTRTYSCKVDDVMELAKAVVAGDVPLNCLLPNQSVLDKQAKALQDSFALPGCKPVWKATVRVNRWKDTA